MADVSRKREAIDLYNYRYPLAEIAEEHVDARMTHSPMKSAHEGYAIILEELDEMWEAIKKNDKVAARKECVQVAAMCLAFMMEIK